MTSTIDSQSILNRRPRVLLSSFVCHPSESAEARVGWNRAVQAARFFDTDVICQRGPDEADRELSAANDHDRGTLRVRILPLTSWERTLQAIPGGFYRAYRSWQRRAYRLALATL